MALISVGKTAPAFSLLDQNEKKVSLKDFKNKKNVVLYFYPKALTPGCTVQAKAVKEHKSQFTRNQTVVLGISPDDPAKLKKFEDKYDLNFNLLSDEGHKVADKYGVWDLKKFMGKEYMGILRTTFIIDKEGKIQHVMDKVKTKTHHEDALNWIQENL